MKQAITLLLITGILLVTVNAQELKTDVNEKPHLDAIQDVNSNNTPMIWGISSFLSSCLFPGAVSIMGAFLIFPYLPIIVSGAFCLGTTGLSYLINPSVPRIYTVNKSEMYKNVYSNVYINELKKKSALYSFIGGALGFILTTLTLFFSIYFLLGLSSY